MLPSSGCPLVAAIAPHAVTLPWPYSLGIRTSSTSRFLALTPRCVRLLPQGGFRMMCAVGTECLRRRLEDREPDEAVRSRFSVLTLFASAPLTRVSRHSHHAVFTSRLRAVLSKRSWLLSPLSPPRLPSHPCSAPSIRLRDLAATGIRPARFCQSLCGAGLLCLGPARMSRAQGTYTKCFPARMPCFPATKALFSPLL